MKEKKQFILDYANKNLARYEEFTDYKEAIEEIVAIVGDDNCKEDVYNVNYWCNYIQEMEKEQK